jgi:hypothetical protein
MSFFHLNKSQVKLSTGLAGIATVLALIACESSVSNEDKDNTLTTAAYGSSECATAPSTKSFYGKYVWTSSSDYTTSCNAIDDTALGTAGYSGYGSNIKNVPTNQADCEATGITSAFYTRMADGTTGGWTLQKTEEHTGAWKIIAGFGVCNLHSTNFPPQASRVLVRVATTVRRYSGSSYITLPFSSFLH